MRFLIAIAMSLALLFAAAPATAQIGGCCYDSGAVSVTAIPNSSSHAAGSSVGGLFVVPLARTANGSGILTSVNWKSTGGSTGQILVRIWQKKPSALTFACGDQAAYAGADSDDANLITPPFTITPAAPAVTTGDSATYGSSIGLTIDYKNTDNPPTQNLYVCVTTVATDTVDENALVRLTLSGPQN